MFLEKRPRPPEEERARFSPPGENGDERTLRRRGAGPPADASPCQRPQDRDHPGPRPPVFAPFCNYGHFTYQDAPWEQTVAGFLCPPFLHPPLMFSAFQHLSHPYPILLHLLRKVCRMADFFDRLKPFRKGGLADSFREKRGRRQARRAHSRTAKSPSAIS